MNNHVLNEIRKIKEMMLLEVSDAVIKKIIGKFRNENPNVNDAEALELINAFERIKQALPVEKKDITRYTFDELKSLIQSQEKSMSQKKTLKNAVTHFKKMGSKSQNEILFRGIRNFFEVEDLLPESERDIFNYDDFSSIEYILYKRPTNNYAELIKKKLVENFKKESVQDTQILYYITKYLREQENYPINTPRVDGMSFTDFEALVDANSSEKAQQIDAFYDIKENIVYEDDNIVIYLADTKPVAIALSFGRSWCTSRKGGGNLFYNYRFTHNLTLYVVVNKTLPYEHTNYALVVLVEPDGKMRLADKSNGGNYGGTTVVQWFDIVSKCPFLSKVKEVLKPIPLTSEERKLYNRIKEAKVGDNPTEYFKNDDTKVALWLELSETPPTNQQYMNLSADMQRKYVALGYSLDYLKLENTKPETLEYIITKSIARISSLSLDALTHDDIVLLNSTSGRMIKIKKERKNSFRDEINLSEEKNNLLIVYPQSKEAKYAALYGLDDLFSMISTPETYTAINIQTNTGGNSDISLNIVIPRSIGKFVNISALSLSGGIVKIPEEVCKLTKLSGLFIKANDRLTTIPSCIFDLPQLVSINLAMNPQLTIPNEINKNFIEKNAGTKFYQRIPPNKPK